MTQEQYFWMHIHALFKVFSPISISTNFFQVSPTSGRTWLLVARRTLFCFSCCSGTNCPLPMPRRQPTPRPACCVTCVQRAKPQPDSLFCHTVTLESARSEIHTTYTHAQQNIQVLSDSYPQFLSRANTLSQMKYSPPWTHMPQSVRGNMCLGRKEIMHTFLYVTHCRNSEIPRHSTALDFNLDQEKLKSLV